MSTWIGNTGGAGGARVLQTGLGMASGTSPSITALASGGAAVAFQANNGALWTWIGNAGTVGFGASSGCVSGVNACVGGGLAMAVGSSPSIGADIAPHGLARIGSGLTTGGPTVKFDVGKSGKPTILAQSCSARAPATTAC
jgi:hypothetical protein